MMNELLYVVLLAGGLFCLIILFTGIRVVNQQTAVIIERFGKYSRTLHAGLNVIIPVIEQAIAKIDLRVTEIKSEVEVKTSDNMFVRLPINIMLQIRENAVANAHYKLSNPREQIATWVLNTIRATTSSMKLQNLFEDREKIAREVQEELKEKMESFGFEIISVLVDQPMVSHEVQASFNRVVASEREKEAATQEAEAKRIRIVGEARAEAESQQLRAQGLSEARRILAGSISEAVELAKQKGIAEHDILHLLIETNRLDTIKYAAEHGKLVVMDIRDGVKPNFNL
jgi:regulator of protease activity HflC (stomatin/prohibitin superfamily)